MKKDTVHAHMKSAFNYAELSYCKRKQVGCLIVKNNNILSFGYNGTPPGWENNCEDEHNVTFSYVYHAEENAILKLARETGGAEGAVAFITCAPCFNCAKMLYRAGIKKVYYGGTYRNIVEGLDYLKKCNVEVELVQI